MGAPAGWCRSGATQQNLVTWTVQYQINYPAAIDPMGMLKPAVTAFPSYFMIDLRTMKIVRIVLGSPQPADWAVFATLLQ